MGSVFKNAHLEESNEKQQLTRFHIKLNILK